MERKPILAVILAIAVGSMSACAPEESAPVPADATRTEATEATEQNLAIRADPAKLPARVTAFGDAFRRSDFNAVVDFMPPSVKATLMRQHGVTEPQLRTAVTGAMAQLMSQASLVNFSMDVASSNIQTMPDGSRSYALIPTETIMSRPDGAQLRTLTQTMAIDEAGEWYLYRIDERQQVDMLVATYPEFAGVDVPLGTMAPVG